MTFCTKDAGVRGERRLRAEAEKEKEAYLLEIDFGVGAHACFPDEVHDPFFAFVAGEVEALRQIAASHVSHAN